MADDNLTCLASSRKEALENDELQYFTGEPCIRGHLSKRDTKSGRCLQCSTERIYTEKDRQNHKVWARNNRDRKRATDKRWRENNKERAHEASRSWRQNNLKIESGFWNGNVMQIIQKENEKSEKRNMRGMQRN